MTAFGLLISYAGYPVLPSSLFPDNGLASLAGALRAAGWDVVVVDLNTITVASRLVTREVTASLRALLPAVADGLDHACLARLREINEILDYRLEALAQRLGEEIAAKALTGGARFVGFKLWSGDGLFASAAIARAVKQADPTILVFAGGPGVLYSDAAVLDLAPVFDALVLGEGEDSILGLAAVAAGERELASVPNLIIRDGPTPHRTSTSRPPELDRLAPPAYDVAAYPSLAGNEQMRIFVLDESRGCPGRCAFCIHPTASGASRRTKSVDRVLSELRSLRDGHGVSAFRFGGSSTPRRFFEALPAALAGAGLSLSFGAFSHPHGTPLTHTEALARAGCRSLFMGVESFHGPDLAKLGKRLSLERSHRAIEACIACGIVPIVSLIVPVPGQGAEGYRANLETAVALCGGHSAIVQTQFPALLPGTPWWASPGRYGLALRVSKGSFRRQLAGYKIRHIIPPVFWEPAPYTVDGMKFSEFAAVNARFQRDLSSEGVLVNVPDETVLIAEALGLDLRAAAHYLREVFFTLDTAAMRDIVGRVNGALTRR